MTAPAPDGLQRPPHRDFKLSTDPYFADKVHDVVGLCLDPPERALEFCVDPKPQIQDLDRSHPVLPSVAMFRSGTRFPPTRLPPRRIR